MNVEQARLIKRAEQEIKELDDEISALKGTTRKKQTRRQALKDMVQGIKTLDDSEEGQPSDE